MLLSFVLPFGQLLEDAGEARVVLHIHAADDDMPFTTLMHSLLLMRAFDLINSRTTNDDAVAVADPPRNTTAGSRDEDNAGGRPEARMAVDDGSDAPRGRVSTSIWREVSIILADDDEQSYK